MFLATSLNLILREFHEESTTPDYGKVEMANNQF